MDKNYIKKLLQKGERITLEAKLAKTDVPKSVWESYSAFANTMGGTILLGVFEDMKEKDPAKRFRIEGVDDAEKIRKDFWNTINSNKVSDNILTDSDVEVVDVDGLQVVCIHVPMADWRVKPVYLNENVYKNTFKRNHEGDYHCTEQQVRAMIRDSYEGGNDGSLMEHYDMNDVDPDTLRRYRTLFQFRNEGHVWNEVDDKTFLKNLGGYIVDRETEKEGLTMAGLMMFGKGLSIQERFANFRMDYIDFCHLIGEERYSDRLTYDGRWENNLYQFFSRVIPKVTFDLPRPFRMEGIQRVDDTPLHKAVREAFTNSIIHADMMLEAGVLRIEKHEDRLVFRNPGLLMLPLKEIYEGGVSKARNPKMQNMLRMIGYGENLGSGFPMILSAWKQAGWAEPVLENRLEVDEVSLVLPIKRIEGSAPKSAPKIGPKNRKIGSKIGPKIGSKKLSPQERLDMIIAIIKNNPRITRKDIEDMLGVGHTTIQNDLRILKEQYGVHYEGSSKTGEWVIGK